MDRKNFQGALNNRLPQCVIISGPSWWIVAPACWVATESMKPPRIESSGREREEIQMAENQPTGSRVLLWQCEFFLRRLLQCRHALPNQCRSSFVHVC